MFAFPLGEGFFIWKIFPVVKMAKIELLFVWGGVLSYSEQMFAPQGGGHLHFDTQKKRKGIYIPLPFQYLNNITFKTESSITQIYNIILFKKISYTQSYRIHPSTFSTVNLNIISLFNFHTHTTFHNT